MNLFCFDRMLHILNDKQLRYKGLVHKQHNGQFALPESAKEGNIFHERMLPA